GTELVEACKLERGAKGLLDAGAGDVDAVDLVEQQMDHVAKRHKTAKEPGADRTEPKQMIADRGVEEQEEKGGKLRMKDASVHGELGEYLVEHMANKKMDCDPEERQLDQGIGLGHAEDAHECQADSKDTEQDLHRDRMIRVDIRQHSSHRASAKEQDDLLGHCDTSNHGADREHSAHGRCHSEVSPEISHATFPFCRMRSESIRYIAADRWRQSKGNNTVRTWELWTIAALGAPLPALLKGDDHRD